MYTDMEIEKILTENGLDYKSIIQYQKKINKVDSETAKKLGKKLFNAIEIVPYKPFPSDFNIRKTQVMNYGQYNHMINNLIVAGADINYCNEESQSLLMHSISKKKYNTFLNIVRAGTDINYQDKNGNTALMLTAITRQFDMFKILVLMGANINIKNNSLNTVYYCFSHWQDKEYLELLEYASNFNNVLEKNKTVIEEVINFDDMVCAASKQMEEILGKSYTKK